MLKAMSEAYNSYCRRGQFIELGLLFSKTDAYAVKNFSESKMRKRLYNGIIVEINDPASHVYFQDCTRTTMKKATLFMRKPCSYNEPARKVPFWMYRGREEI